MYIWNNEIAQWVHVNANDGTWTIEDCSGLPWCPTISEKLF